MTEVFTNSRVSPVIATYNILSNGKYYLEKMVVQGNFVTQVSKTFDSYQEMANYINNYRMI